LPLTSVEAPLPAFSFGQLFHCYRPGAAEEGPLRTWQEVLARLPWDYLGAAEWPRALELLLRAVPMGELTALAEGFAARWSAAGRNGADLVGLLRKLFNEVSLSPWTNFAEKVLALVRALEAGGVLTDEQAVDFLAHLLRQLGRHLSAYD